MSVNFRGDECMFHFFLSPESAHCDVASIQNQTAREGTDRLIQKGFAWVACTWKCLQAGLHTQNKGIVYFNA